MRNKLSFLSFWSINDALNLEQLKAQLDELRVAGLDGVIFHPRFYPNEPVYMSEAYLHILSDLIMYAKQTGMIFWLYDENGWPSGTASGEVIKRLPDSTCKFVNWNFDEGGGLVFGEKSAVSSLDPLATATFIEITHEGYRKGLRPEAFDYVTGFFADEVAFLDGHGITVKTGAVPWDDRFPTQYEAKYGEALLPQLPLLFTTGEGDEKFRVRYWEMLTDVLVSNFYQPVADWCKKHGKKFTAHLKAEESPFFQLSYSGSAFQVLRCVETPAIDALERYPGNNFYPRIAHSIAMQQGREGSLVEAMGGSGWGVSPESFTNYVMWLASHGVDHFVFHLNQLKLTTQAIQDWPPSMPCHLTWKEAFPSLLASIQEQAVRLPDLRKQPDVLIVTPTRGIMATFETSDAMLMNEHDGSQIPLSTSGLLNAKFLALVEDLYGAGVHYELTEERVIEQSGILVDGRLRIGIRGYTHVLLAEGCRWEDPDLENRLRMAGITICTPEDWQRVLSAQESAAVSAAESVLVKQTPWVAAAPERNQVYLELEQEIGLLRAELQLRQAEQIGNLTLFIHDEVNEVRVNGEVLNMTLAQDGFEALVPASLVGKAAKLLVEVVPLPKGEVCPIAFLRGRFAVSSQAPLLEKDEHQWVLAGPWVLTPLSSEISSDNLISAGFPFGGTPITVSKSITLLGDEAYTALEFTDLWADAALVKLNGNELGWCWAPRWSVPLPTGIQEGTHELEVLLYPSTYNQYGPHRHVDGDRYLTSPDQYAGVKNFADRPDAPEQTKVDHYHFVKWGISGDVRVK
ncbi:hypothetical protein [Paenibacillus roseipurpureus]|uniref:Glycoside hydrolase n=1 Tax=Paenibacillus roseopurpureus TaxID=2918901 RepID=A0AA96LL06_9BACL|nr:hypothetical protein [Paenibacillus sp. MBLB1832]WNR43680.1 hypothetical protein MJB10_21645 [Paenibacillus sp. MBLB1832]